MSNSHECIGVKKEALQQYAVYKTHCVLLEVAQESVSVLQDTQESVSYTTIESHVLNLNVQ